MDNQLIPAHVLFARWFIRIRWAAIVILIFANWAMNNLFHISIQEKPIYLLTIVLCCLNILHWLILRVLTTATDSINLKYIKNSIHIQIITDLVILALILHYSGGIENPLVLFFFFHMIIASSIFSTFTSYLYAGYALVLLGLIAFLEAYGIIPHYHLVGFIDPKLDHSKLFLYGTGVVFFFTSIMVVSLSHMIINRSIKSTEMYARTNDELENKDRLKNEYVLRVTHDIKGHLAAILSCLEVLRQNIAGPMNETQEEFVNRAFDRTRTLSNMVKNLLNLTRMRLQKREEFEEYSLRQLIEEVTLPIQEVASEKSIKLNFFVESSIDKVYGNPLAMNELFTNLLMNAVKYTPFEGHIELMVRDKGDYFEAEVTDSGIGIPKEDLENIFDEFYRASNAAEAAKAGTGLGLSIVKQIVESHQGTITADSEPGEWTRFTVVLPKRTVATPQDNSGKL
jgi:signal transduction histidine kinase